MKCKTIIFGVHAAPTFHHDAPEHTEVRKNDFQTRKESILMHYDNICKRDTAGYFKEAFGRF